MKLRGESVNLVAKIGHGRHNAVMQTRYMGRGLGRLEITRHAATGTCERLVKKINSILGAGAATFYERTVQRGVEYRFCVVAFRVMLIFLGTSHCVTSVGEVDNLKN